MRSEVYTPVARDILLKRNGPPSELVNLPTWEHFEYDDGMRIQKFFYDVSGIERTEEAAAFLVAHLRPKRVPYFLYPFDTIVPLCGVLPKPKTSDPYEIERAEKGTRTRNLYLAEDARPDDKRVYPLFQWDREHIQTSDEIVPQFQQFAEAYPSGIVICDNGGYFAPIIHRLKDALGDKLLGVVEDTKNGEDKYRLLPTLPLPIFSVATSPRKVIENLTVGQQIESATMTYLEDLGRYKEGLNIKVLVIGAGNIGSAIAYSADLNNISTTIFDIDPKKMAQASENGYPITTDLSRALRTSDVIYSATGNHGLRREHFPYIKKGAEVIPATSGDDEFDLQGLEETYELIPISETTDRRLCKSKSSKHYFYLSNGLIPINFTRRSVDRYCVLPLQAEIIRDTQLLLETKGELPHQIIYTPEEEGRRISKIFADSFKQYYYGEYLIKLLNEWSTMAA